MQDIYHILAKGLVYFREQSGLVVLPHKPKMLEI